MLDAREHLSNNLRQLLATKRGSRLDQSRDIEVPDGTLGRILYRTGNPTLDSIERIAQHYGVEVWQLFLPDLGRSYQPTKSEAMPAGIQEIANAARGAFATPEKVLKSFATHLQSVSDAFSKPAPQATAAESVPHGSERQKQIAMLYREALQDGDTEAAVVFERLMQMTAPGKKAAKTHGRRRSAQS